MRGDKDGDAVQFSALACPGHRGHFGRGKPPPPMVPPMQHDGTLACVERKEICYHTVRQGGRAGDKAVSGGIIEGELGEGISGLWRTFGKCDCVQVSGKVDDRG